MYNNRPTNCWTTFKSIEQVKQEEVNRMVRKATDFMLGTLLIIFVFGAAFIGLSL